MAAMRPAHSKKHACHASLFHETMPSHAMPLPCAMPYVHAQAMQLREAM